MTNDTVYKVVRSLWWRVFVVSFPLVFFILVAGCDNIQGSRVLIDINGCAYYAQSLGSNLWRLQRLHELDEGMCPRVHDKTRKEI